MQRNFIGFFLLIFVSLNLFAQEKVQLNNLNPNEILKILFEVKNLNKDGKGKWKPNVYERNKMPVSDDGYCYTGIDTIIYASDNDIIKAIVVFETIEYSNSERVDCHGCSVFLSIATFEKKMNVWELTEFEKFFRGAGTWGYLNGKFEIKKLGKDLECIVFYDEGSSGQGYSSSEVSFYNLGNVGFKEVFSYESHESSSGEFGDKVGYNDETKINYIKSPNFYKIELVTLRNNKQILKRQLYNYSESLGKYVPINVKAKTSIPKL